MASLYEKDFYAWTEEQAQLLQTHALSELDIDNLVEEIRSMGASEKRELGNRLAILLMHLLKWKYQPELQCRSWQLTIEEQRNELRFLFKQNPSLKNPDKLHDTLVHAYSISIIKATQETGLKKSVFPTSCEWDIIQILDDNFYPTVHFMP